MNREVLLDPQGSNMPYKKRAFTPYEALMSAAPGQEIEPSQLEMLALRDILQDALEETLTPIELWIFNSYVVERQSLRVLGRQINRPKTTVARMRDNAVKKLRVALQDHPLIIEYLERP
jgi:hypothetical protein